MEQDKNPTLTAVISTLISSVARARESADINALRIARRYRNDDLLKGLPVPRLRFKAISVSLPIIISGLQPGKPAKRNTLEEIARAAQQAFTKQILESVSQINEIDKLRSINCPEQVNSTSVIRAILEKACHNNFTHLLELELLSSLSHSILPFQASEEFETDMDVAVLDRVGDLTEAILLRLLGELVIHVTKDEEEIVAETQGREPDCTQIKAQANDALQHEIVKRVIEFTRYAAEAATINTTSIPPEIRVCVDTEQVKHAGSGDPFITRINFTLQEDGLEWVSELKSDGSSSHILSPE